MEFKPVLTEEYQFEHRDKSIKIALSIGFLDYQDSDARKVYHN